ncbi:MAG: recombinase family protein [Eubacteriales bacterium]|jgi:DNA invertase Pin-like site-specific DNA recombinase
MAKIERVSFPNPVPRLKRVAAYARVSSSKDAMLHSLSAQVSAYSEMIQKHPGWQYVGVYADEAKTGTKDSRENFQRLLADCRSGKVDMIITKSISRFARNTVTVLKTVRELKAIGVDVFFEEQNIHTLSADGELMMTILAGYAEAESRSASENMKWRIKKKFEEGSPWNGTILGYRYQNGAYVIHPEEARIVRRIFREYLSGKGIVAIMNGLNADGVRTRYGNEWHQHAVCVILRNRTYTGNLLLQKTYSENYLIKKTLKNTGELPKYSATGTHEAIISAEEFNAVQAEIDRRAAKYAPADKGCTKRYPFSALIVCDNCRKHYRRRVTHSGAVWICSTLNTKGKSFCPSKQIPEKTLNSVTEEVIGNIETIHDKITAIRAKKNNTLVFCLADSTETVKRWQDRSRAESWTDEMKASAREKTLKRQRKTKTDSST